MWLLTWQKFVPELRAQACLLAVINDILDISKIQSGKYTLDASEIALEEVLQISIASLELMAAGRPSDPRNFRQFSELVKCRRPKLAFR